MTTNPESLLAVTQEDETEASRYVKKPTGFIDAEHPDRCSFDHVSLSRALARYRLTTRPAPPAQPGREEVEAQAMSAIAKTQSFVLLNHLDLEQKRSVVRDFAKAALTAAEPLLARQDVRPADLVERVARIIDPSSWAVMDSYLEQTKRKYAGQNVGWPEDQFKHKESMAKAREILSTLPTEPASLREENARLREALANPPKHRFWGAGEPDCPREIKAGNGELHTLRCKVCGLDSPRDAICRAALPTEPASVREARLREALDQCATWLDGFDSTLGDFARAALSTEEPKL